VTDEEVEELVADCPTLYHMAELGAWSSIQDRGLLSTSALLDMYNVNGAERSEIESQHRPACVEITGEGFPRAIVRDQIPMSDAALFRCLPDHLTPSDWYRLLNSKVFFWLTRDRLHRLTNAKAYKEKSHDVIEVDTKSIIGAYRDSIWFCPINSGCTKPMARGRDETTFARIEDYPYTHWRKKRKRGERVVELAIDYSVPDLAVHVSRVVIVKGATEQQVLFSRLDQLPTRLPLSR
jgi:hypothetical protein